MTCGRKDWEPVSEEITVRPSQTDACKLERVHHFIFYSSLTTGLALRNVPEATVLRHGRTPNFNQHQDFRHLTGRRLSDLGSASCQQRSVWSGIGSQRSNCS